MSMDLHDLREGAWSLDDFVEQVNRLLPDLLPKDAGKRAAEPVNQRLVRHYATQGLLDEPLKEGREARYLYRHLLQLLVIRRLLAEGFTAVVVGQVLENRSDGELEGLVTSRLRIDLVPENAPAAHGGERAEFLRRVRQRAGLEQSVSAWKFEDAPSSQAMALFSTADEAFARPTPSPPSDLPANPFQDTSWSHVTIMDGLELHVRDDFRLPQTRLGDAELAQLIKVTLLYLEQKQRGKP